MIQRDYLMRQVQSLIQALQEGLALHRQGETSAALEEKLAAETLAEIQRLAGSAG